MTDDNSFRVKLRSTKVLEGPFPEVNFETFPGNPHDAFKLWFDEALEAGVREPHAMTVSTVDDQGWPDARVLILKNVDARGWHFAIKADSPKGKQLAANSHAALTFYWPQLARQVRLRGKAIELPEAECVQDYNSRPLASKISAMASRQSEILLNQETLRQSVVETEAHFSKDPSLGAKKWKVYAVTPEAVEFWQGDASRLHKRLQYVYDATDNKWQKHGLWP
ncbi:pyridoxamine 5'-phosphate oxidase [Penicillium macrosclerotiorum]|uniref:pyridoxamine 5'-phosphate oxidase n=1 Tax=Penicillium macrosclerotiorum TaxID=303699 RepID=UPI0025471DB4|nr:pyridoxamine 5'-phosphate oxidase [Penicillium macrosclerotiorum]KAJ5679597.1 pyridoxamine 5'-phosphate oxidase [Penicillium macrosclerotiorum]